jgi:hypothetical protein
VAARDLAWIESAGTVHNDAPASPTTRLSRNHHVNSNVNCGWGRRAANPEHAPELAGTRVAQDGPGPARQDSCHPPARLAQPSVPDSNNTSMNAVEPPGLNAA